LNKATTSIFIIISIRFSLTGSRNSTPLDRKIQLEI